MTRRIAVWAAIGFAVGAVGGLLGTPRWAQILVLVVLAALDVWRHFHTALPPCPEGVRIRRCDGTETPCTLTYSGRDEDGCHIWAADQPFDLNAGDRLQIERMPGRTGITFPVGGVR